MILSGELPHSAMYPVLYLLAEDWIFGTSGYVSSKQRCLAKTFAGPLYSILSSQSRGSKNVVVEANDDHRMTNMSGPYDYQSVPIR